MSDHIQRLRELTQALSSVPAGTPAQVLYRGMGGSWIGTALHHCPEVAVQLASAAKGVVLPWHNHNGAAEILIVVSGRVRNQIGDEIQEYGPGECMRMPPHTAHEVTALEDATVVAVTIPAEGAYPHE